MYTPEQYRGTQSDAYELMKRHPLGLLVCNREGQAPWATHLPTVIPPETRRALQDGRSLQGLTICGHMNRANPHWNAFRDGDPALLIFSGPNSYISPAIYGTTPAAPTWNFASTHLHGRLRSVQSREETLQIIHWTVLDLEGSFGQGWDMTDSLSYFDQIVCGVGAFAFEVDNFDCMVKMSQDKEPAVRRRVIDSLSAGTNGGSVAVSINDNPDHA